MNQQQSTYANERSFRRIRRGPSSARMVSYRREPPDRHEPTASETALDVAMWARQAQYGSRQARYVFE